MSNQTADQVKNRPSGDFALTPVEDIPERKVRGNVNAQKYDDLADRIKAAPGQQFTLGVQPQGVANALRSRGIKTALRDVGLNGNPKNHGTLFVVYLPEEDTSTS